MNCKMAAEMPKLNPRPLNSPRSTIGENVRRSTTMNPTRKTALRANVVIMNGEVQPMLPPRLMPNVRQPSIPNNSSAPGMSSPRGRLSGDPSTSSRQARNVPTTPNGTRVQKIARQSIRSSRTPPSAGPAIAPAPTVETISPSPVPRFDGGNAAVMIAAPFAIVIAEPTACRTRVPISSSNDPDIADNPVATVSTMNPTT